MTILMAIGFAVIMAIFIVMMNAVAAAHREQTAVSFFPVEESVIIGTHK